MKSRVWVAQTLLLRNTFTFHLSTSVKTFHTFTERRGEKKSTAIIILHQHAQISEILASQVKGCSSFILQRHANALSLSVFYLHSNKLGLLNALGRIKVEVCFECIQRGW